VLVALGGNAMTAPDGSARPGDQIKAVTGAMEPVADLVADGYEVALTHGNGPQVGNLLVKNELAAAVVPPVPLDWCGAQTQATLGFFGDFFSPDGISSFSSSVVNGRDNSTQAEVRDSSGGTRTVEEPDRGRIVSIVGAVQLGTNLTENGILGFLVFFVAINITIGIFNLLPMLPLDGGHVVVATYERIREFFTPKGERYYVDMVKLMPVIYAVFIALIVLGLSTMWLDIVDPAF
jgi:membrane-associated protease RseP (regulator of RpoE activity)